VEIAYSAVETVIISDGVIAIEPSAFQQQRALSAVKLPKSLRAIGSQAFQGCRQLANIDLPDGLVSLGEFVFPRLPITELYLPPSVASLDTATFAGMMDLQRFNVSTSNEFFCNDEDGLLWSKNRTTLIAFPLAKPGRYLELPSTALVIGPFAVGWHPELARVVLSSVVEIGPFAFVMCTMLWEVILPPTLTKIGAGAFGDCLLLSRIVLPDSLEIVDDFAFRGCAELRTVNLGKNVSQIGEHVFKDSGVSSVSLYGGVANISSQAFVGATNLTSIVVQGDVGEFLCPALQEVAQTVQSIFVNTTSAPKVVCENVTVAADPTGGEL
jgi:hypothetical protein